LLRQVHSARKAGALRARWRLTRHYKQSAIDPDFLQQENALRVPDSVVYFWESAFHRGHHFTRVRICALWKENEPAMNPIQMSPIQMNLAQATSLPARLLIAVLALALLAACAPIATPAETAADTPVVEAPAAESSTAAEASAPAESAETRTVTHPLGESIVPANPQRIVSIGEDWMLADLLNLGVKPVASTVNIVEDVAGIDAAALEGIQLWTSQSVTLEAIVETNPDLIIGNSYWVETIGYDLLSQIAPVVPIALDGIKEQYVATAAALGLEADAAAQVAAYEQRVADAAAALGDDKPAVSVATIYAGASLAAWIDGPAVAVPTVLVEMGVPLHPGPDDAESTGATRGRAWLSMEQLPLFDGEILILLQTSSVEGEDESVAQVQADPLWALLPAVQSGNVHVIDRLGAPGFAGLEATLDQMVEILNGGN